MCKLCCIAKCLSILNFIFGKNLILFDHSITNVKINKYFRILLLPLKYKIHILKLYAVFSVYDFTHIMLII